MVKKNKKCKHCTSAVESITLNPKSENKMIKLVPIESTYSEIIMDMITNLASIRHTAIMSINNYSTISIIASHLIDNLLLPYIGGEKDEFEIDEIKNIFECILDERHELNCINEDISDVENSLEYVEDIFQDFIDLNNVNKMF